MCLGARLAHEGLSWLPIGPQKRILFPIDDTAADRGYSVLTGRFSLTDHNAIKHRAKAARLMRPCKSHAAVILTHMTQIMPALTGSGTFRAGRYTESRTSTPENMRLHLKE